MTTALSLFRITFVLATTSVIFGSPAATPAIGMAVANGSFQVDRMRVSGNASLFDGSVIETASSSSQIQLNSGQRLRLSSETRAQIYRNKLVLESGFGQMETAPGFEVEARTLRISAVSPGSVALIRIAGNRKVMVAAVRGAIRVTNAAGLLVANVPAGSSLDFEPPQPAAGAGPQTTGTGAAGTTGTTGTAGTAGAATGAGIGTGTIVVIGGVAVAATLGGLAVVGSFPGQGEDLPTAASR